MKVCIMMIMLSVLATVGSDMMKADTSHSTESPFSKHKPTDDSKSHPQTPKTCPVPSEEMLQCVRQWVCQRVIRIDLRCLLNLHGNPLLIGLLGNLPSVSGIGGGGNLLGNLLGIEG